MPTKIGIIHYSKNGVHIVPAFGVSDVVGCRRGWVVGPILEKFSQNVDNFDAMSSEEQNQVLEKAAADIREKAASVIQDWAALSTEEQGEVIGKALTQLGLSVGGGVAAAKVTSKIAAFASELASKSGVRRVLKAAETIAEQGAKHADDVVGIGVAAGKVGQASNLVGKEFENYLVSKLGGRGSFKLGGREFDGAIGNRWYEAKSGRYWEDIASPGEGFEKFKADMGSRLRIAQAHGATYELHSNTPIPRYAKDWLTKKGITYYQW